MCGRSRYWLAFQGSGSGPWSWKYHYYFNFKEVYIMFHDKIPFPLFDSTGRIHNLDFAVHPDKDFTRRKNSPLPNFWHSWLRKVLPLPKMNCLIFLTWILTSLRILLLTNIFRSFLRPAAEESPINVTALLQKELIPIRNGRKYSRLQTAHFRKPRYFIYRAA